jgi:chemotaxis protein MotB
MRALHLALIGTLTTACVSRRLHDEQVRALSAEVAVLDDKVEEAKGLITRLKSELDRTREALATRSAELDRLRTELTQRRSEAPAAKEDVQQVRRALTELAHHQERVRAALDAWGELGARFQALSETGALSLKFVRGQVLIELPADPLFDGASDRLTDAGEETLAAVAFVLKELPARSYQVMAHTDDPTAGGVSGPEPWQAAAARAIAVTEVLVARGLDPHRLTAATAASYLPVAPNRTEEGRAANRRIELLVQPDPALLPGYEELTQLSRELR